MRYQKLKDKINKIRTIIEQNELKVNAIMLDEVDLFLEHKSTIVSVIGAKAAGKCSIVNSMLAADVLPTSISKPRVLYSLKPGTIGCNIQTKSGVELPCKDLSVIDKYSKSDYDLDVCVGCGNASVFEIRTGFDIDNQCPDMGYLLSDVVVLCLKASALLSLNDVRVLDYLKECGHENIVLCITHLNNVNSKEISEIARYISAKQPNMPVVYYSDEALLEVPEEILNSYGVDCLKSVIEKSLSREDVLDQRFNITEKILEKITGVVISDLEVKRFNLLAERDLKYAEHSAKIAKKQLIRLGWSEIRVTYEKLQNECVESILLQLNKAKNKIIDKLKASIISAPNPKEWWEKILPIMLKNEIDTLSNLVDTNLQSRILKDLNWLNRAIQNRFKQTLVVDEKYSIDTLTDFEFDPNSHTFKNLRTARYISMAGSSALATLMFFVVGPVGALVSATCGIISDRYINKETEVQRDTLKGLVAGVVDEAVGKIADMIPARVRGLYNEFSNAIGEKEKLWVDTYGQDVFECAEDKEIETINDIINHL